MKCLIRYCSLFFCLVLLFSAFSPFASAAEIEVGSFNILESVHVSYNTGYTSQIGESFTYVPNDGNKDTHTSLGYLEPTHVHQYELEILHYYEVKSLKDNILADADMKTTIRLENIYYSNLLSFDGMTIYDYNPYSAKVYVHYVDDTLDSFDATFEGSTTSFLKTLKATFTPAKDIKKINFEVRSKLTDEILPNLTPAYLGVDIYLGEWAEDGKTVLVVKQPSEEANLLDGILGWIQNIFNGITDGFAQLGQKLSDVWTSITDGFAQIGQKLTDLWNAIINLPAKIWEFIENGLKSLFIPDDDFLVDYKDRVDELLSSKLGAVYEVVNVTFGAWEQVGEADETNTINIPVVSIPLPDNNEFSFGGYDVEIVPTGFEFIIEVLKLVVGIVCTILFINGLRHRYDEVMGVEK